MSALTIAIKPSRYSRKISVELDAERFERLAAGLGFFNDEFIASVDRAEHEISEGKTKRLRRLKDIRSA